MVGSSMDSEKRVIEWIENVVIGLNLCPFAKVPWDNGEWEVTSYKGEDLNEARKFALDITNNFIKNKNSSAFIIFPQLKLDFIKFYNFSALVEQGIEELGLSKVVQCVTFHPEFRFQGEKKNARGNYVNRSPYPLLHLLDEGTLSAILSEQKSDIGEKISHSNSKMLENMPSHEFSERVLKYIKLEG